jgi:hypothetical protein
LVSKWINAVTSILQSIAIRRPGWSVDRAAAFRVALGVTVTAVPFLAYSFFILDHFYRSGALLNDSGYLAHMMFAGGPALLVGQSVLGNSSFYAFHVSPLFTLLSFVTQRLPLSVPQLFALYAGACHALLTVGVFWMLTGPYRMRSMGQASLAGLLALGFGFNGVALGMIKFPHFEILIPASLILFLIAWSQGRLVIASLFFAVALAVREDAGLQIFALLGMLAVLDRWMGFAGRRERGTIVFLAIGLAYSLAAIMAQRMEFSVTSLLTANYLGDPPFSRLTWQLVLTRFFGYFTYRAYIMLPALCAIAWAAITRNPYIIVGYLAFAPWFVLQLLSVNDAIGTIPYHYAYPFILASFWPLIGVWVSNRRGRRLTNIRGTIVGFAAILAASYVGVARQANPSGADLWHAFTSVPSFREERSVDDAIRVLHDAHAELGRVAVEDGVAALGPDDYAQNETFWLDPPRSADTVIYFPSGYRATAARQLIASENLQYSYSIIGTPIRMATDRALPDMPRLAPFLVSVGHEPR